MKTLFNGLFKNNILTGENGILSIFKEKDGTGQLSSRRSIPGAVVLFAITHAGTEGIGQWNSIWMATGLMAFSVLNYKKIEAKKQRNPAK